MNYIELPLSVSRRNNKFDKIVFTSRVRISRNIEGLKFAHMLSNKERDLLAEKLLQFIKDFDKCEIGDLNSLSSDDIKMWHAGGVISKSFIQKGRYFAYNKNGEWVIWLNEDDHIKFFSIQEGYNIKRMSDSLFYLVDKLETKVDFAFHEKWGYLTPSPLNIGTGFRMSVILNLFGLRFSGSIEKLQEALKSYGYELRYIVENEPLFLLDNIYSMGISESEMISEFEELLERLLRMELKERDKILSEKDNIDAFLETIYAIKTWNKLNYKDLVYYISMLDMLNNKVIKLDNAKGLRRLIFQGDDNYLNSEKFTDKDETDYMRIQLLIPFIDNLKYIKIKHEEPV